MLAQIENPAIPTILRMVVVANCAKNHAPFICK
jgi:hypothetical protein